MTSLAIFQRTLQDLVKGIRNHSQEASSFICAAIADIKVELKSIDPYIKAEAVRKLTYLQMMGYDVTWAAFSIIEVYLMMMMIIMMLMLMLIQRC